MVESQPSKLLVAGSIPVSRSSFRPRAAACLLRQGVPDGGYDWSAGVAQSHPGLWTDPATGGVRLMTDRADVAQLAERVLGKDEVTSSILVIGSSDRD